MSSHPDADAFVAAILADPAELTTRLAFADWLEESGDASNAAWARFIRLMGDAGRHPDRSDERRRLELDAAAYLWQMDAKLTVPAAVFVEHPRPLLQLLPAWSLTVALADVAIPLPVIEIVPESVARENLVIPLRLDTNLLYVATSNPGNWDLLQKLQFILNRDIIAVRAEADAVLETINRHYGLTETESVDSVLVDFTEVVFASTDSRFDPARLERSVEAARHERTAVRVTNQILTEAIQRRATGIRLLPELDHLTIDYRIGGAWVHRDNVPRRLWSAIATRIAIMASIPIDAIFERRFTATGRIPLQLTYGDYDLLVTAGERIDGIHIEIKRTPNSTTPPV